MPKEIIAEAWRESKIDAYRKNIKRNPYQSLTDLIKTLWTLNSKQSEVAPT